MNKKQEFPPVPIPESIFTGTTAPHIIAGLERSMLEMRQNSDLPSRCYPDLGDGVEATFEFGNKKHYEPDVLSITFDVGAGTERKIKVSTESVTYDEPSLNLGSGDWADSFPSSIKVKKIDDSRLRNVSDGVRVIKRATAKEHYSGKKLDIKEETILIVPFTSTNPSPGSKPTIEIEFGHGESFEQQSDGVLYEQQGSDGRWTKSYYSVVEGKIFTASPEYDVYTRADGKIDETTRVKDIPVASGDSDSEVISRILSEAGDMGGVDQAASNLVGKVVKLPNVQT